MADVEAGRDQRIFVDVTGVADDDPVTITVYDPERKSPIAGELADNIGGGRFAYTLIGEQVDRQGIWEAYWYGPGNVVLARQKFTVGPRALSSMTRFQLRRQVLSRVTDIHYGQVTDAQEGFITDSSLIGSVKHYVGWWVVIGPGSDLVGMTRRVIGYNGSSLQLNEPLPTILEDRTQIILSPVNPREVDEAVDAAFSDFRGIGRVEVTTSGVEVTDHQLTIPEGYVYLSAAYRDTYDDNEDPLIDMESWDLFPGRVLRFEQNVDLDEDETVTLNGIRRIATPVWEQSVLDIEPQALISRAATVLHANRAAGPGVDIREHLRRQIAAFNEQDATMRRAAGRLPPGIRTVLE